MDAQRLRDLADAYSYALYNADAALLCRAAAEELERLRHFIRDLPCECHDDYGRKLPVRCGRCEVLGLEASDVRE